MLKDSTIDANSVIGEKNLVPEGMSENEIWARNPAKFIKPY